MSSIGYNSEAIWQGLLEGNHGVKKIKSIDVESLSNQYGCEIEELDYYTSAFPSSSYGRATRLFLTTLEDALFDAGLSSQMLETRTVGLCVGTTMGEISTLESSMKSFEKDPGQDNLCGPHIIAEEVANYWNLSGPIWTLTNACAAGNFSIARAMQELMMGRAEVMIAGGVDVMSWTAFTGFSSLRAMSPDYCRPFDSQRKGLLLGEGCGVLILETKEHLSKRKGKIAAALLGYGLTCDGHHITQPDPLGKGAISAMGKALKMGGIQSQEIDYINAHGTGTLANDHMEAKSMSQLFGSDIRTSSIKGHIGHTLGAASAIEAVMCVKALGSGWLPPTLHMRAKDPLCNINVIANEPVRHSTRYILSNAYAFGGINSSLLIAKND